MTNEEFISTSNEFREEAKQYGLRSDHRWIRECKAYQKLLAAGQDVVPLVVNQLRREYDSPNSLIWEYMYLLSELLPDVREKIIPQKIRGYMYRMQKAWVKWGRIKGYVK